MNAKSIRMKNYIHRSMILEGENRLDPSTGFDTSISNSSLLFFQERREKG